MKEGRRDRVLFRPFVVLGRGMFALCWGKVGRKLERRKGLGGLDEEDERRMR